MDRSKHPCARAFDRLLVPALLSALFFAHTAMASDLSELKALSFEELLDIEVTSVSKRAQSRNSAAAAITVITSDDIRRSGHKSVPEALRLVPGIQVARVDASTWAISARGFNEEFANKLLVLIDGRTVYTPLFAGVYWDVQDLVLEDIDRIEVIRGPGGALWGANAVNGVINIITKSAHDTQGVYANAGGGSLNRGFGAVRYGGSTGDLAYRVYGKGFRHSALEATDTGRNAGDDWWSARGGFRADWNVSEKDQITFQGDYYRGEIHNRFGGVLSKSDEIEGGNLLARARRDFSETSSATTQIYYDRTERTAGTITEDRDTIDVEVQFDADATSAIHVSVGAGYRYHADRINAADRLITFDPRHRVDHFVTGFAQAQWSLLGEELMLTLGSKVEHNPYSAFEFQPTFRAAWMPSEELTFWGAISRAVRTPSQSDEGIRIEVPLAPGTRIAVNGSKKFRAEDLLAYEIGARARLLPNATLDVTAFLFDYEDLRTSEPGAPVFIPAPPPPVTEFPSTFSNRLQGRTYGVEAELKWQPIDWLDLTAIYSFLDFDLSTDESADPNAKLANGSNPTHSVSIRSSINLPYDFEVDAIVYFVDDLPKQVPPSSRGVDSYWRGDLRIAWAWDEHVEVALVGQNLFSRRHPEFGTTTITAAYVPRSVYGSVSLRY